MLTTHRQPQRQPHAHPLRQGKEWCCGDVLFELVPFWAPRSGSRRRPSASTAIAAIISEEIRLGQAMQQC